MKGKLLLTTLTANLLLLHFLSAQNFITEKNGPAVFPIVTPSQATSIYVDENDDWLIHKAASLLQADIEMVTGKKPAIISTLPASVQNIIIIGTIGKSSIIEKLIKEKKINIEPIKSKWESFKLEVINKPFNRIPNAFIITGSDKRGTAYGVFELSSQMGVSPWYWWADVPVKKKKEVYIKNGSYQSGPPSVKYRGIFINDEAPAFSGWTKEKFGGVNHNVYEKIFELLLRLKANYLWPAMWGNAFNDDDTLNPIMADKYGIVMGTSHHEPMLRAQQEWKRHGKGQWNYDSNAAVLKDFWRKGIQNMGRHESILTIGMRGDGDMPMTQGSNIALLERIVSDQRKIIEEVTGKPASQTPQLWALYKEVQDYYDKGMRVPDDVTLLLCDDNWGNIRKLPNLTDKKRTGGYGIYYHFDYVGGPRNYKWLNTNNIARVWEQMHLAYEYGVDKIWIVNVGDLKPMEFPISFFLDYAWDTKKWNENNLNDYYTQWAAKQFGTAHAKEIGDIIRKYSQYNARRKPELLSPETYSFNYDEAKRIADDYEKLLSEAEKINTKLPSEYKDAFFELVLHPIKACANLNQLYTTVTYNKWFSSQNWLIANKTADKAKQLYLNDSLISVEYNRIANGKWNHMMDQTHIGYTYWQQPARNRMPDIKYVSQDSAEEQAVKIDLQPETAKNLIPKKFEGNVFFEQDGYTSIEAAHYTRKVDGSAINWKIIPGIGRDGDGIITFPVTADEQKPNGNGPHLEYEVYTYDSGEVKLSTYFSPTLNFHNDGAGLRYGISIDDEQPQIISINKDDNDTRTWEQWVANNIIIKTSNHTIARPGKHTVKFWMVNPAVVLQKIIIDFGGVEQSYLGPPETKMK
jgi:Glycosyl hydrolase family 115/Gylcosyl hydrolase family 115 C-terminal domain